MAKLSPKTIVGRSWFLRPKPAAEHSALRTSIQSTAGLVVAAVFWWLGYRKLALTALTLGVAVVLLMTVSGRTRLFTVKMFRALGQAVSWLVSLLLFLPTVWFFMPLVRGYSRIAGRDPLQLRARNRVSWWLPSDADKRKIKYARAMFCSEPSRTQAHSWPAFAAVLVGFVIVAEVGLRLYGYGSPITYAQDPTVGYYPAPNQSSRRRGGEIHINNFGMRAPDMTPGKPTNTLRILMLGDSTLYGGSYVSDRDLYARQLALALKPADARRQVQILNIGANNWGPFHELGYVEKFGTFQSEIAVVCLPTIDVDRPHYGLETLPYMPHTRPPRLALEEIAYHLTWRYRARILSGSESALADPHTSVTTQKGVEAYVQLVKRLRAQGIEVFVEVLPCRQAGLEGEVPLDERARLELLEPALTAAGALVNHPAGLFKDKGGPGKIYHDMVHLDLRGHRLYAEYLKQRLLENSPRLREWVTSGAKPSAAHP